MNLPIFRRHLLLGGAASAALGMSVTSTGLLAQEPRPALQSVPSKRGVLPSMTEGPFYPSVRWRESRTDTQDWDADLTRVTRRKETATAQGEHLDLQLAVMDTQGRLIDAADVEIWQCDVFAVYQHPDVNPKAQQVDPGFQGFGAAKSGRDGQVRFRTIRPTPYPGRTPHIHLKLRHASFGEWTSQLFVANDPGNERDGIWRRLSAASREAATLNLKAAQAGNQTGNNLRWKVEHVVVLPA